MAVDVGVPDTSGLNGGERMTPWLTGGAPDNISGQAMCPDGDEVCSDVWRRDFTNAIVLFRPYGRRPPGGGCPACISMIESEMDTYSVPLALGGTYYPLKSDGTAGSGITSIQLRGGEGAILMKSPRTPGGSFSGGILRR
jgi:hypothetical protein